jgi:gluconate kinase
MTDFEWTVLVLMGVSGSGKTTIGQILARELGLSFYEGDLLHPPRNVAKMTRGEPLDDQDRAEWLHSLRHLRRMHERTGHFMKETMVASQFAALEEPRHALTVGIGGRPDDIVRAIVDSLARQPRRA